MADGRILSKRITRSDKVSGLSTDTARMIYSWIIPYLDVDGRMEANPRLMKSDIAPLLDHITPKVIQDILDELKKEKLIILYQVENKQYLQLIKFDENQPNLRKDREKKSQIPEAPAEVKPKKAQLRQDSGEAPAEVPHKINISKDNISKVKESPEETAPDISLGKKNDGLKDKPFVLPDWIPKETWEAYLECRKKKRAAPTNYAFWLIINELEKIKSQYGHDPVKVLNKSITSGWTDVYPLKDEGNGKNKPVPISNYAVCLKCGEEHLKSEEPVRIGGIDYCQKCPEVRQRAPGELQKVGELISEFTH
jgi:hypothetical protein